MTLTISFKLIENVQGSDHDLPDPHDPSDDEKVDGQGFYIFQKKTNQKFVKTTSLNINFKTNPNKSPLELQLDSQQILY